MGNLFFYAPSQTKKINKTKVPFFSQNPIFHANKSFGREKQGFGRKKRDLFFLFFSFGGARLFWITSKWAQKVVHKSSRYWQTVRDFQFFCKDRSSMWIFWDRPHWGSFSEKFSKGFSAEYLSFHTHFQVLKNI